MREAPGFGSGNGPMGHQAVRIDLPAGGGPTLNHVTLPAGNYEASIAFYRLLGCRQIVASPPRYARFEVPGGMTLSIEVVEPAAPPSSSEYFFQCDDVDAAVAGLTNSGLRFDPLPEDRPYLWRVAETRDPHGNRICLYSTGEIRRFPPWRID
jgi:hydroxymethylpyrimidine/phosphomethylpyrimidine kinase